MTDSNSAKYVVKKIRTDFDIVANPAAKVWQDAPPLAIERFSWRKPGDPVPPKCTARLLYSDVYVYVLFSTVEKEILARQTEYQGSVCTDSCVEFFFAPNEKGYLNFEINCIGTLLCEYGASRHGRRPVGREEIAGVRIAASLPQKAIAAAVPGPRDGWFIAARIPFADIERITGALPPKSGDVWRANLYKCADHAPHPAWGSWAPIDLPKPDFHRPEFFGRIVFE